MNTISLLQPEIPPNTGTIARMCVVTHTKLDLVGKLGFELSDKYLKRASMDYWQHLEYRQEPDIDAYIEKLDMSRSFLFSTKASRNFSEIEYPQDCVLLFGNESSGTPDHIQKYFEEQDRVLRIPMHREYRSLNIAISAGIALYEVLRQQGYNDLV